MKHPRRPDPNGVLQKALKKWRSLSGLVRGLILLGVSILVLAVVCFAVYKAFVKPPEIEKRPDVLVAGEDPAESWTKPTKTETIVEIDPETGEPVEIVVEIPYSHQERVYNVLLVGTDGDGGRTDTIMILHVDAAAHQVCLLSVPRDTLIDAPYSVPKINSAYGAGGRGEQGMRALEVQLARILGFDVDGYMLIDLKAFCEIVDLIGGVYFDVPCDMYYSDPTQNLYINLSRGYQLLDGSKAMQMCRFRSYPQADIARVSVQQNFVRALAKQCLQVVNISKVNDMVSIISSYLVSDLTVENMAFFATELLKCDFDEMETFTLPGEGAWYRGGAYYMLYTEQVLELVNAHFNPYDEDITEEQVTILTEHHSGEFKPVTVTPGSSLAPSPQTPQTPDTPPAQPEAPKEPEAPEEPIDPEEPEAPEIPDDPEAPEAPEIPDDPEAPEEPEVPDDPEEPDDLEPPETPEDPETPDESEPSTGTEEEIPPSPLEEPGLPEQPVDDDTETEEERGNT